MSSTQAFWAGNFGTEYHKRDVREVEKTMNLWRKMIWHAGTIRSAIEFGAGTGTNLEALKILTNCRTAGVEINPDAFTKMAADVGYLSPVLDVTPEPCKLAFTKGFLIHVPPEDLQAVYSKIFNASTKYVLLCEYFNPVPVEIEYRGHSGRLWKRDFAREMMESFPLTLIDYGFSYGQDPEMPSDNMNWFLLSK